jgi:S-DNA-T family DNA segregation ATPase FtsK/SpoIIIE
MFKGMYEDTFFYLGGLHGYNVSSWLESQVGVPGVLMILFFTAVCLLAYLSTQTILWLRKLLGFSYLKRKKKEAPVEEAAFGDTTDSLVNGEQQGNHTEVADEKVDTIDLGGPDDNFVVNHNPAAEVLQV